MSEFEHIGPILSRTMMDLLERYVKVEGFRNSENNNVDQFNVDKRTVDDLLVIETEVHRMEVSD